MNLLIKQLASKHALYVDGGDGKTNYTFTQESLNEFAELIVRDCMDVVDGYTKQRTFDTHYDAVEQIEALFGIKHNVVEE
jgi:hypothetical protein